MPVICYLGGRDREDQSSRLAEQKFHVTPSPPISWVQWCIPVILLETWRHCHNHKSDTCLKVTEKAKFTSVKGYACTSYLSHTSQHTHRGMVNCFHFIPTAGLPLCSQKGAQVHSLHDWLRSGIRGQHRGRGDKIGEHGQKQFGWCTQRQRDDPWGGNSRIPRKLRPEVTDLKCQYQVYN
jgi:hypothetical protein